MSLLIYLFIFTSNVFINYFFEFVLKYFGWGCCVGSLDDFGSVKFYIKCKMIYTLIYISKDKFLYYKLILYKLNSTLNFKMITESPLKYVGSPINRFSLSGDPLNSAKRKNVY
jgi:hypothetical protein